MTSNNYVIPADTEQWLSGIGARVPRAEYAGAAQNSAPNDNQQRADKAVVNLDGDTTLGGVAAAPPDNPGIQQPAAADRAKPEHLDTGATKPGAPSDEPSRKSVRRFTPWVVGALSALTAVGTVITATMTLLNTASPPATVAARAPSPSQRTAPPPPAPTAPPTSANDNADAPLPFTASSDCDNAGSTPAQSVAEPTSDTPWVCVVHGAGQVLTLQLGPPGLPQAYVLTGVSIIPGAIGAAGRRPADPDPWLAHQVPTLLQWHFSDPANLFLDQNTYNRRGVVPMAVPRVLASKITIIIRQTSRPPTDPTPTNDPGANGVPGLPPPSIPSPALPGGLGGQQPMPTDPSDGTFAVTSIKVFGHKAV